MVEIVPIVCLSAFEVVFLWFSYGFVWFPYGVYRPPSLVHQLSGSFPYGFLAFFIVLLVDSSAFVVVFV